METVDLSEDEGKAEVQEVDKEIEQQPDEEKLDQEVRKEDQDDEQCDKKEPMKILVNDFEMLDNEWDQKWDMINNAQVQKRTKFSRSANRELVTSNNGFGEIEVYLNGATRVTVSAVVLPNNQNTVIKYRKPNSDSDAWFVYAIPCRNDKYKLYTFPLPGPFNEPGAYRLRFGTEGTDKKKSHFEEVQVVIYYD